MLLVLSVLLSLGLFTLGQNPQPIEDKEFWYAEGKIRLERALVQRQNVHHARNVIVFVGDGMGITTVTAARIFKEQQLGHQGEEGFLTFDTFPHVGLIKTYNVDKQVPDSAGTGTAISTGVKTNYYTLGVDATAKFNVCDASVLERASVSSVFSWAQAAGKHTGFVTTTRVTHATPASTYAHTPNREWECDAMIPEMYQDCATDIARQLVENSPGRNLKVIMGGGLHQFGVENSTTDSSCKRKDGRNLVKTWRMDKARRGARHRFVRTMDELMAVSPNDHDFVLGLFSHGHMAYDAERDRAGKGSPSLVNMTVKAIEMLQKGEDGFVLVVEGGRIDHAHHANYARLSLLETVQFDAAVAAALDMTNAQDTLVLVTADHSHTMTMNGYPKRGNDILGFAHKESSPLPYETLTYANGPGFKYHRKKGIIEDGLNLWKDPTKDSSRSDLRYTHFAPIFEKDESHGGEDVAIYATGPFSHLFNGVHEQSYIAHALSCAGRFGPNAGMCVSSDAASVERLHAKMPALLMFVILVLWNSHIVF